MTTNPHPARYTFRLTGKVKPAVRMTRRGMWVSKAAQEYLLNRAELAWQMKTQLGDRPMMPEHEPLVVSIEFFYAGGYHHMDLDNCIKTICDAGNGILWHDDRWIDTIIASRKERAEDSVSLSVWRL